MALTLEQKLAKLSFNVDKRLVFYEKLLSFVKDGISPYDAIRTMNRRFVKEKASDRHITQSILKDQGAGNSLADALSKWVPDNDVSIIRSGEVTDDLPGSLIEVIRLTGDMRTLKKGVGKAVKPAIVQFIVLFGIIYALSAYMIPEIKTFGDPENYPGFTLYYFGFADFIAEYFVFIAGFFVGIFLWIKWAIPNLTGVARPYLDRVPPFSIARRISSGYFLLTVAAMMSKGVSLIDALSNIQKSSNPYQKKHILQMKKRIGEGFNEGDSLNTGYLPPDMAGDIIDYGGLTSFSEGIASIANRSVKDILEFLEKVSGSVKIVMLALLSTVAVLTIVSIMMIVLEMTENMQLV
ncbi:MAG: type II secretion system F family protein [Methyloprofundus sp.]|nr:type II secretion system F family protein [Methyloprofundus sp.]